MNISSNKKFCLCIYSFKIATLVYTPRVNIRDAIYFKYNPYIYIYNFYCLPINAVEC